VARASAYYPGALIQPDDLNAILEPTSVEATPVDPSRGQGSIIKELEREIIVRRLVANQGNQRRTAKDLGMAKSTLHDRIRHYSIDVHKIAGVPEEA
jgi:DNA-binding NtrC family response regulator